MDLNFKLILRISGLALAISGAAMMPSMLCALIREETGCLKSFIICGVLFMVLGFSLFKKFSSSGRTLRIRDGYMIVGACWLMLCLFGAFPYYFSGYGLSIAQSLFESTAGYTTTGASNIIGEIAPRSLLLYRSTTHWLGGMGILVLAVSVLPALGIGGQNLARAEMPSPKIDKVTNKISDSARILYITYFAFTLIEFILLAASAKMDLFEATVNTLSTISTGGLMTHAGGLAFYDSGYIETVVTCFSFLAAINFNIYFFAINRRSKEVLGNSELRTYICIVLAFSLLISLNLSSSGIYESFGESMRHAVTQVISFASTSGFAFADFNQWPMFSRMLLFVLLFIGGCAASTSGGMKVVRVMVMFKLIRRGFRTRIHPRSVVSVRLGNEPLTPAGVSQISTFILMYFLVFIIGALVLSIDAPDLGTAMGTSATCISNTGITFGDFSTTGDFSMYSSAAQLFMGLLMIIGRLELFTILMLFTPGFWNPNRQKS